MSDYGIRGQCPECGRDIGVLPASEPGLFGWKVRTHKDDGARCPGSGKLAVSLSSVSECIDIDSPDLFTAKGPAK